MTGTELQSLLKASPQKAHKAVFDEYCKYVYTIVFNRLRNYGSREDIDECVSDVFADIFLNLESKFVMLDDLKGYIGNIAQKRAIDTFRRISSGFGSSTPIDDISDHKDDGFDLEEKFEKKELRQILIDSVNELGKPDSDIIILKYYYNRTSKEIARKLTMKDSTVRMRCVRAMKRLKEKLSGLEISY